MSIKDILLHVDASRAYSARLRVTLHLAHLFEARVVGIMTLPEPDSLAFAENGAVAAAAMASLAELEAEAEATGDKFVAMLGKENLDGEWRIAKGPAAPAITRHAHAADLVVLGQHDPEHPSDLIAPEDVVLACGRPVLIVPNAGRFEQVGETVVIAWNGSREATWAVHEALPLMAMSKLVTAVSVRPSSAGARDGGQRELARHLVRHGLKVTDEAISAPAEDVAETVLTRAADLGADLIVMGAFGRSRLREMVLGGATQDMLEQMTLPVLMAH